MKTTALLLLVATCLTAQAYPRAEIQLLPGSDLQEGGTYQPCQTLVIKAKVTYTVAEGNESELNNTQIEVPPWAKSGLNEPVSFSYPPTSYDNTITESTSGNVKCFNIDVAMKLPSATFLSPGPGKVLIRVVRNSGPPWMITQTVTAVLEVNVNFGT